MDSTNPTNANLKKYIKVDGKWRFVPVLKQNGVPYPGTVLIDGIPTRSTTGTFYLEFYEDGRRVQRPVGNSPRDAKDAWNLRRSPKADLEPISEEDLPGPELTGVGIAFDRFLEEVKATKEKETYIAYRADLNWVTSKLGRRFVGEVTRQDILRVMSEGREANLNPKTVSRRLLVALMALRNAGAVINLKRGDWPKTTDKSVEIYEEDEMRAFFDACSPFEKLGFQTFLCSGFRKREVCTLTWSDVDFRQRTLKVQPKPEYHFKPKNHEERTLPVPPALVKRLLARKKTHGSTNLIFPTKPHPKRPNYGGSMPDEHHLELCKEIAWRAKLNCRRCVTKKGKCAKGPYCHRWNLHKWRHTFATKSLQSGVDIKSLQVMLGHKNLSTTEKYLKSLGLVSLRAKIDKSTIARMLD